MSFSVNEGSEIVYTLPNNSGSTGDYLTSGGYGNNATWTTASDSHMYGQVITLWMSSSSFVSNNGGKSPKINGSVQSDWYYCNGATITTNSDEEVDVPDMRGRVIVGVEQAQQNVSSGGDYEISDPIPTPYHNHDVSGSTGQGSGGTGDGNFDPQHNGVASQTAGEDYTHTHDFTASFNNKRRTNVENDDKDKQVVVQIDGVGISGGVQGGHKHTHSVSVTCGNTEYETTYAGTDGDKIFKFYKLYYIIYLP